MRLLDLFAGIGGFSLAAHWMGWETVAFVEKEKFCQQVLRKNFGSEIEIHDDIFDFSGKPFRGSIDIITGGFPCQPFSAAGKRKGRADERHLFPEMLRVISEVRPRWVVAENVRGLLSIESGSVFAEVITSLESEGYEVITFCVPASAVEAPHRRDRLWIVGYSDQYEPGTLSRDDGEVCGVSETQRKSKHSSTLLSGTGSDVGNAAEPRSLPAAHRGICSGKEGRGSRNGELERPNFDAQNAFSQRAGSENGAATNEGRAAGQDWSASLRQGNRPQRSTGIEPAACNASQPSNPRTSRRERIQTDDAGPSECGGNLGGTGERVNGSGNASNARCVTEPLRTETNERQAAVPTGNGIGSDAADSGISGQPGQGNVGRRLHSTSSGKGQVHRTVDADWFERSWIEVAAEFCRVDDVVPNRVDRLKALGNSIVPQIALEIFRAIEQANGS